MMTNNWVWVLAVSTQCWREAIDSNFVTGITKSPHLVFCMSVEYDTLLDNCIDALLNSDLSVVDDCVQQLPSYYHTFLFLRLNTMNDHDLKQSLCNLMVNPINRLTLANRTPVTGLCCDDLKRHNFTRCHIWVDSGLVNLENVYSAWDRALDHASLTTVEQGVVFFSQLSYYSAHANVVWNKGFERWLQQITETRFSMPSSPNFTSYVSDVSAAFVGVIVNASEPIKSELFWRCTAKLDTIEHSDAVVDFLRGLVDYGCEFNLPSYPFGVDDEDVSGFIHEIERTLFQLSGERLKRLAGIEDSGNDSERRKI